MRDRTPIPSLSLTTAPQCLPLKSGYSKPPKPLPRTRTIAVTSGKGGVGKTNFVVNVTLALAARGKSVTILDADLALANVDVLLGINPAYHIGHVLSGERSFNEIVIQVAQGVKLIPGSSGMEELTALSHSQHDQIITDLEALDMSSNYLFIDTAAGIASNVMGILCAASEVIVVTMPEPTAIIDSYATIKALHKHSPAKPIGIVVNGVIGLSDAEQAFDQLRATTGRFLNHPIEFLGAIMHDGELVKAVREQVPVVEFAPHSPASRSIRLIAEHIDNLPNQADKSEHSFWRSLAKMKY
ncbi:MAG: MinD/ParA family protein [Acidobacteriota bacterium]